MSRSRSSIIPPPPSGSESAAPPPRIVRGIAGSPGVAVGPALVIGDVRASFAKRRLRRSQIESEIARVGDAVVRAKDTLRAVSAKLSSDQALILEAYLLMLEDPLLHERVNRNISEELQCAEWAVASASDAITREFGSTIEDSRDSYIQERRHDVEFVCDRLLRALTGHREHVVPKLDSPAIVVARDLSPADTAGMIKDPALGFVTEIGTRTSHTSIMARALEIPAVVGAPEVLEYVQTGDLIIVDGLRGQVIIDPDEAQVAAAKARAARYTEFAHDLLSTRHEPCVTADGEPVALKANVELPNEAQLAMDHGAAGIGLYRTEFLYIDRATLPSEDEQYAIYKSVVQTVSPHPVTLRTFDIGGDKFASSFKLPEEMNPALGLRAVRLALKRPEVLLTQLRAMVRASAHGDVRIMIPMVAQLGELHAVRELLDQAIREVVERGEPAADRIPLGIMVELPATAVMADVFAQEVDFFSIGTNDLIQYSLAIDRTSRLLAHLASPFDPAVLRLIDTTVRAAMSASIPVSLCGAMASDLLAAPLLLGLGLRELSMEAAAVGEIKAAVRRLHLPECRAVAAEALKQPSAARVEELLAEGFATRLHDLLAEGELEPDAN